ncbi:MAG: hypothetical protein LW847_11870 [Burkholderiales bacterium]|jgi:hypothetical protein|nr:hypothetical protein [Burkholderiales bacterium]
MFTISQQQVENLRKLTFYRQVESFIDECSHREDFVLWCDDQKRLRALWEPLWPAAQAAGSYAAAVVFVLAAVGAFEGKAPPRDAAAVLARLPDNEVGFKKYLADHGYFDFTALDYPRPSSRRGRGAGGAHG